MSAAHGREVSRRGARPPCGVYRDSVFFNIPAPAKYNPLAPLRLLQATGMARVVITPLRSFAFRACDYAAWGQGIGSQQVAREGGCRCLRGQQIELRDLDSDLT